MLRIDWGVAGGPHVVTRLVVSRRRACVFDPASGPARRRSATGRLADRRRQRRWWSWRRRRRLPGARSAFVAPFGSGAFAAIESSSFRTALRSCADAERFPASVRARPIERRSRRRLRPERRIGRAAVAAARSVPGHRRSRRRRFGRRPYRSFRRTIESESDACAVDRRARPRRGRRTVAARRASRRRRPFAAH